MTKYLMLLFYVSTFSQINGKWSIIRCYPDVNGLSKNEKREFINSCIGEVAYINKNHISFLETELKGKIDDIPNSYKIINNSDVEDSLNIYLRYRCQEISYLKVITRQTIDMIDKTYNKNTIDVLNFKCNGDKKIICCYIYIMKNNRICLCIPGDAFYYLKKISS